MTRAIRSVLGLDAFERRAARGWSRLARRNGGGWLHRVPRLLPATPDQIAVARRTVRTQLDAAHPVFKRIEEVTLVVSEVVTNALVHGRGGVVRGELELLVLVTRDGLRVCVRDAGSAGFPCITRAGTGAVGGRGMALVDRLADRWGFLHDRHGCVVWTDFGDTFPLAGEGITT